MVTTKAARMTFWIYILECRDGSYYTGHTDDIDHRIAQHDAGLGGEHTRRRLPVTLRFIEGFGTRAEALAMELRVKGWSRAKKQALFARDWQRLHELAKSRQVAPEPFDFAQGERRLSSDAAEKSPFALSEVEGPAKPSP